MDARWEMLGVADREAIRRWRYEGPCSFYDLDADPGDLAEFLDPPSTMLPLGLFTKDRELMGFMTCEPGRAGMVEVGLGLRPDLTGRGFGAEFVESGLGEAGRRLSAKRFWMAVAAFNARAVRLYRRLGLKIVREYMEATNGGVYPFIELERAAEASAERGPGWSSN